MANFDHWMRLNIGDYLADTMHLSTLQNGIYLLLIFSYFKRGFLPDDSNALAQIAKLSNYAWRRHSPPVLALFRAEGGRLIHKRIDRERQEAERLSSRARASRMKKSGKNTDSLARAPVTTATTNNPPPFPPVIDLHSRRRKKAAGGWAGVASDLASEEDSD